MTPMWKVSDEEVWTAIRYLDPDDDRDSGKPDVLSSGLQYVRSIEAGVLIGVLLVVLCVAGVRYLPAAMDLFR